MPLTPTHLKRNLDDLACVHPNAAGLDIGSEEIVVAVPPDRDQEPVRVFATFTVDLHALVAWLLACGIDTVALESTGVFWIPIYELLEQAGITPYLVNARHVKTVPGRKTDWNDAQWLQKLHAFGLLQGSFRPDAEIRTLRTLARYRAELIERRAPHINHMIQALKHMNLQLNLVLSDVTGVSGLAMLRAIIAGERDPKRLAEFRQPGCKHSDAEIVKALTGTWDDAQVFILQQSVDLFDYYTSKIVDLVAWLLACGIDTVALESTGVFWIPIYELLEQAGITPYLVNARHVKTVPGRKTDWNDAQWLQKLHAFGLLQGSFRPDAEIRTLRTLARYRAELIERRAPHINHMIQALKHMNLQLNLVLSDVTGVSGLAMLRAIIAGERDPKRLAEFRQPGCKHSDAEIVKALTGTWDDAQVFILQQSVDLFDYYTSKIVDCDQQLHQQYQAMESRWEKDAPLPDLPPAKGESKSKNAMTFNARSQIARVIGVDLVSVMGLSAITVQTIISEIGTDMECFPTVKHFCSWLGLAPRNDISGGKVLRSRTMKVRSRANQAFRQAAHSVTRSDSSLGAYYRAMRARLGPKQAIVATAHKIARTVYHLLKTREPYREESAADYDVKRQERELKHLQRRAQKLGYTLTAAPTTTPEVQPEPAS